MTFVGTLLLSALRVSTPLLLAAMGGLLSERAGVIQIALEGMMLIGALAGAAVASVTHSPELGALAGAIAGSAYAGIYGVSVLRLRSDQIVAGTAMNLLAMGLTPFICKILYGSTGGSAALDLADRFQWGPLAWGWVAVGAVYWLLVRTRFGLRLSFAGEHPDALRAAGVSVLGVRWRALFAAGALAGLGGVSLSVFLSSSFTRNMTAGRGFMALAALILGRWKPWPTAAACFAFGLFDALQIRLQGVVLWGAEPVPVQFIQMLPYVVTIGVLGGRWFGKARAPSALGRPLP